MKRIGAILSLSILITLMAVSTCFAAGFQLTDSYPTDGYSGLQPKGVAIKLSFNQDISSPKVQKINEENYTLVDSKNKKVPTKAYYSSKNPNDVIVLVRKDLTPKAEYKFTLSGDFESSEGTALGERTVINFKIRDTGRDANVNMLMMGIMVVGMIIFTSISTKKEMKKAQKKDEADGKFNPYKIAKETGKPIEEVIAQIEKDKQKAERKRARNGGKADDIDDDDSVKSGNYKVKGPKPISATGSKYITGRKAEAEKAKEKEKAKAKAAAKNTNPKNATGKKKNKKK